MTINTTLWNGRTVPRIGLGCWAIGGPFYENGDNLSYGDVDDEESTRALHAAFERGVQLVDTASVYGAGHSETLLSHALQGHDDVMVATKIGILFDEDTKQVQGALETQTQAEAEIHRCLRRLKRDHIDLMQLHLNDADVPLAASLFEVMERFVEQGKIGAYGWSTDFPESVSNLITQFRPKNLVSVQHAMNVFYDAATMLDVAEKHGLQTFNRSPLAMGLLTGKYGRGEQMAANDIRASDRPWMDYFEAGRISAKFWDQLDAVRELLTSDGRSLTQGAICWLWARHPATFPIPGFKSVAQINDTLGALEKGPLSPEIMQNIEALLPSRTNDEPARPR